MPKAALAEKRLVDEAVVEKKFVEVALVSKTSPTNVDEAVERRPFEKPMVVEVETPQD